MAPGVVVIVRCPSCEAENPDGKKFCGDCGARLSAVAAERRVLSVMFCDLIDSTPLSAELDPEDMRSVMSAYRSACEHAVGRLGGHVAQWLGDGVLVYFGYPTAREDDGLRSVLGGLAIVDEVGALDLPLLRQRGFDMRVRVGIHIGPVVVGEIGRRREELAEGETPNIAARIQSNAHANTVVVSDDLLALVRDHVEYEELPPVSMKGVPRSQRLYRIIGATGSASRMQVAARTGFTPYVGREGHIASLLAGWERARRGDGPVVLVSGVAGLGKSRLVEMLKERVGSEGEIRQCQCSPLHRNTALYPIVALLERCVGLVRDAPPEENLARLERLAAGDGLPGDAVPLLAPLLSIPVGDRYPPTEMTPQRQRRRTLELLRQWFLRRPGDRGAALIVLEDVHWADPTTLELVGAMIESVRQDPDVRVMLVTTFRSDELAAPWALGPRVQGCELHPLTAEETAQMARAVVGARALPAQVVRDIVGRAGGVPLFVEELTRFYIQTGALVDRGDHYALAGPLPSGVPTTLKGLLVARLDRLDARAREVAQLAATIGRSFGRPLLAAVSGAGEAALGAALDALVRAEFVVPEARGHGGSFAFKHALVREAAYEMLLKARRQEYHEKIARTLEERFPALKDSQPELIAGHFTGAGEGFRRQAARYWCLAGEQALSRSDNVEAISHLSKAAEFAGDLPAGLERDLAELSARRALAPAQMAIMGWPSVEVERTCGRVHALCQKLLGQGLEEPTQGLVRLSLAGSLWGLWTVQFLRGNLIPALGFAHQVLGMAQALGNGALEVMGHHAVGFTDYFAGRFAESERHARAGIARFDVAIERAIVQGSQFSSTAALRSFAASSMWNQGRPDEALRMLESAYDLVRTELHGHPPSVAYLEAFAAYHFMFRRDLDRLARSSAELRRISYQEGFLLWLPFADAFDGIVEAHRPGGAAAGLALLRRGIDGLCGAGCFLDVPELEAWHAEILLGQGRPEEALAVVDAAIAGAAARGAGLSVPELHRLRGEAILAVCAATGADPLFGLEEAEPCFRRAIEAARAQGALMLEMRAARSACAATLGRARPAPGDAAAMTRWGGAVRVLREVLARFEEGFATPDLREARAVLESAAGPGSGDAETPGSPLAGALAD